MTTRTLTRKAQEKTYAILPSPVGPLWIAGTDAAVSDIRFGGVDGAAGPDRSWTRVDEPEAPAAVREAAAQLRAYFAGTRRVFDVALAPSGTPFQLAVWEALRAIPWGETVSYGTLAGRLGRPGASRAVGLANGSNPIPIVIPCHRVIGADGSLTGFGGGLPMKQALLALEGAWPRADRAQLSLPGVHARSGVVS